MKKELLKIGSIICLAIGAITVFSGWYTVNQGDRGILLRLGRVVEVSNPGFHFKIPWIDTVYDMSVRTIKITNTMPVYSKDIQSADMVTSINYSLNPAFVADIYTKYNRDYQTRVIIPQIMAKTKDVFGQYNAVEVVRSREKIAKQMLESLQQHFENTGIHMESLQIENIDFSNAYEQSVEERMKAEVEVERVRQNLEREKLNADMVRTKAQGEADAKIMAATAEAEAIKLRGDAEASAIKAKADALARNENLVTLIQAERWNGILPTTVLPNTTIPIIGAK